MNQLSLEDRIELAREALERLKEPLPVRYISAEENWNNMDMGIPWDNWNNWNNWDNWNNWNNWHNFEIRG